MLHFATDLMFCTDFKPMGTDHLPAVQQSSDVPKIQLAHRQAIGRLEAGSGCCVDLIGPVGWPGGMLGWFCGDVDRLCWWLLRGG
jgi:hypothetical protein